MQSPQLVWRLVACSGVGSRIRVDIRLLLAIGAIGMVSSLVAMAMQQSLMTYYIASLIYGGFGFSVLYAPLVSTSGEWFPQQRGLVTGVVTAGGALGQGLLPFAGTFLIQEYGWRLAFAAVGGGMLATLALSLPILRWPQGFAPSSATVSGKVDSSEYRAVAPVRAWADLWFIWLACRIHLRFSGRQCDQDAQPSDCDDLWRDR